MTDRLDARIRAFVVELVDQPVTPPPFPGDPLVKRQPEIAHKPGSRWMVAAAVFIAVMAVGLASLLWSASEPSEIIDTTPGEVIAGLTETLNSGNLEATLAWFAEDAQCVAPTLPSCADLFGFFVAANAHLVLTECRVEIEPYMQCFGYLHTNIHDALGLSVEDLAATPNFQPAMIIEDGRVRQFNLSSPFTGNPQLDDQLWAYLLATQAEYVDERGVPQFSAEIVPQFIQAARSFASQR